MLVIEDRHLIAHAEAPEYSWNWQINLPVVNDRLCNDGSTEPKDFIDLFDLGLWKGFHVNWIWKQGLVGCNSKHVESCCVIYLDIPVDELFCNIIIKLQRWSQSNTDFVSELKFHKWSLLKLLNQLKCWRNELVSDDDHLLLGYFLDIVSLLVVDQLLGTVLLPYVLTQEVDGSVHIYGSNEGDKFEIELFGWERE